MWTVEVRWSTRNGHQPQTGHTPCLLKKQRTISRGDWPPKQPLSSPRNHAPDVERGSVLKTTNPASNLPITLADIKKHLRIEFDDDNDYITDLAWVAYRWIEDEADITISQTTYQLVLDGFTNRITFPKPPLQSITSVQYFDTANQSQTLTEGTDFYLLQPTRHPAYIEPVTCFPSTKQRPEAVTITYVAGYTTVPDTVLHLERLLTAHLYENREAEIAGTITTTLKVGLDRLIGHLRWGNYK